MYALTGLLLSCLCSCPRAGGSDVAERRAAFADASRVFAGVVVAIDTVYDLGYTLPPGVRRISRVAYHVETTYNWKGAPLPRVYMVAPWKSAECAVPLEVGKAYLLYLPSDSMPWIGVCTRILSAETATHDVMWLNERLAMAPQS